MTDFAADFCWTNFFVCDNILSKSSILILQNTIMCYNYAPARCSPLLKLGKNWSLFSSIVNITLVALFRSAKPFGERSACFWMAYFYIVFGIIILKLLCADKNKSIAWTIYTNIIEKLDLFFVLI